MIEDYWPGDEVSGANRFRYDAFEPLTIDEFKNLTQSEDLAGLTDHQVERLWLVPVQRWIQEHFRIDQRNYSSGTDPSLAELEEDFKVAVVLSIDKFARNEGEQVGTQQAEGASVRWTHEIPMRAKYLMQRFERTGGRHGRA